MEVTSRVIFPGIYATVFSPRARLQIVIHLCASSSKADLEMLTSRRSCCRHRREVRMFAQCLPVIQPFSTASPSTLHGDRAPSPYMFLTEPRDAAEEFHVYRSGGCLRHVGGGTRKTVSASPGHVLTKKDAYCSCQQSDLEMTLFSMKSSFQKRTLVQNCLAKKSYVARQKVICGTKKLFVAQQIDICK